MPLEQAAHFLHKTGGEHGLDAEVNPLMEHVPRPEQHEHAAASGRAAFFELRLQMADRPPRGAVDLQRANDTPLVMRVQLGGGQRVDLLQAFVQRRQAGLLEFFLDRVAELPIRRRAAEDAAQQGLQIQRRSPDEQHFAPPAADLDHGAPGGFQVVGDAELVARRKQVQQVMGHALPLLGRRLGGADVHLAIEGHRVQGDDLRVQPLSQFDAHPGFPAGRGPGQIPAVRGTKVRGRFQWRADRTSSSARKCCLELGRTLPGSSDPLRSLR